MIVRKGSESEYPVADAELDYYQPVTIRLFAQSGRHLDHLAKVVAPVDEVKRYMDDIMDRMTRAEYVLLAMRLPRGIGGDGARGEGLEAKGLASGVTEGAEAQAKGRTQRQSQAHEVLWTSPVTAAKAEMTVAQPRTSRRDDDVKTSEGCEERRYLSFIASVSKKVLSEEE